MGMDSTKPLAVKQFVDALRSHCQALSKENLINAVVGLGLEARPYQRQEYLERIAELTSATAPEERAEPLLARCTALVRQIHARWVTIYDGTWWDEPDVGVEYDDEMPPTLTQDQEEDLLALFTEADALFLEARYTDAERIYSELLPLFSPDEHDMFVTAIEGEFDLRESRARHARCAYETASPDHRVDRVLEALDSNERWHGSWEVPDQLFPTLTDVANAAPEKPVGFDAFVEATKRSLRESARDGYRDEALYLEAVHTTAGEEGLRAVVDDWSGAHPRAYLEWMKALHAEQMWTDLVAAARAALAEVPGDSPNHRQTRRIAAKMLANAGDFVNDPSLALEGRRTWFKLQPSNATLAELLRCATPLGRRQEELAAAIAVLERSRSVLHVEALLIAGNLGETLSLLDDCRPLGWSSGHDITALCFSAILAYRILPRLSECPTIDRYLRSSLMASSNYPYWPAVDGGDSVLPQDAVDEPELYDEVIAGLSDADLPKVLENNYVAWAESIAMRRIDAIVSNVHRGAYRRAAIVLVALAERLLAEDRRMDSIELIARYRTKYNRHRAFKAELAIVLGQSALAPLHTENGAS